MQKQSQKFEKETIDKIGNAVIETLGLNLMKIESAELAPLPIHELKQYLAKDLTEPVFSLLRNNGIKTIGQFESLTEKDVQLFKAKGKQSILKNNIMRALTSYKEMRNEGKKTDNDEKVDTNTDA